MNFMKKFAIIFLVAAFFALIAVMAVNSNQRSGNVSKRSAERVANRVHALENSEQTSQSEPASQRLNPPHGQPGHICEIPVGEPLPEAQQEQGEVVLNPPHGEPGHVCEIPVGEPLNR